MFKKYLQALSHSFKDLYRHPVVFLGILALLVCFMIAARLFGNMGMASGFIMGLVQITALTFYFNWLNLSQAPRRFKIKDLTEFNYGLFISVLNVAFVLFICDLMLRALGDSPVKAIAIGINFLVVIAFNVLPEVINKHQYQGLTSFSESLDFMKRRWIEWALPVILPILPMLLLNPKVALLQYAVSTPLMPFFNVFGTLTVVNSDFRIFLLIPLVIFAHWLMLFRRRLYDQFS